MNIVNKPVQVVTTLDRGGIIKPVCFFGLEDGGNDEVINVNRLIRRDKERIGGHYVITFTCEITMNNIKTLCDLRLDTNTDEWVLYRR